MNRSTLLQAVLLGALCIAPASWAQYRPPPATEAERDAQAGDDLRSEAAKSNASGDKAAAQESFRKAITLYEKALALEPRNADAAAGLGAAANALGDYDRAVKVLTPMNAAQPNDNGVAFQLGVALYKQRKYAGAVPLLEQVAKESSAEFLLGHYYLANYYLQAQRGDAAVGQLVKYLQTRPLELAGNDFEINVMLGRGFLLWKKPNEARASFERAQKGRPELVSAQMGLAGVLELEGKVADSIKLLEGLASRNPKAPEPKERLGRLYLKAGNLQRADMFASELVKLAPSAQAHLLLGEVRMAQKQLPAAEDQLETAVKLAPTWPPVLIALARAYQQQARHDEGIGLLERAAQTGGLDLLSALGSANRRAGRFQRAVEVHLKVRDLAPKEASSHALLGADYFATGEWDKAIESYTEAVALDPKDARIKHWLAMALSQRARLRAEGARAEEAVRDLRRAFDFDHTPALGRNLGIVLLTQKNFKEARSTFEQVTKLSGATWKDSLLLGYALLGEGRAPDAVTAFETAAKLTKEEGDQAEIYAGWAMAKLDTGEFDTAVAKLMDPSLSYSVGALVQANIPIALVRRSLEKVRVGDVANARKDLDALDRLKTPRTNDVIQMALYTRALIDAEEGRYDEAASGIRQSLSRKVRWANEFVRPLSDAYVDYRRGRMPQARKAIGNARKAEPRQLAWSQELSKAVDRRDGERSYASGNVAAADKALKAAAHADPLNPYVVHNLACVQYVRGGQTEAVRTWESLTSTVPEALLNLGIDSHRRKAIPQAVDYYSRYLSRSSARAGLVSEWRDRLQRIYGLTASTESTAGGADAGTSSAPAASENVR